MPRQGVSAENNPGEKSMMRKFAIAVFALSLTALGCGSDSGSSAPDAANAVDGSATPGAEAGAPKDGATPVDGKALGLDGAAVEVAVSDVASTPDAASPTDLAKPTEAGQVVEAGKLDVAPAVDGGPRLDGGAVDSNTADAPAPSDAGAVDAGTAEAGMAADADVTG
jgi:hypothetical protein